MTFDVQRIINNIIDLTPDQLEDLRKKSKHNYLKYFEARGDQGAEWFLEHSDLDKKTKNEMIKILDKDTSMNEWSMNDYNLKIKKHLDNILLQARKT